MLDRQELVRGGCGDAQKRMRSEVEIVGFGKGEGRRGLRVDGDEVVEMETGIGTGMDMGMTHRDRD